MSKLLSCNYAQSFLRCRGRVGAGFTIVELLIVIVVIGILAAIVITAYAGVQDRARTAKIQADLRQLNGAIQSARTQTMQTLGAIDGSFGTASPCKGKANGTDLAALPKTDSCWTTYAHALDVISTASGTNVRSLIDPWGRPYFIDENENESGPTDCRFDTIAVFQRPFVSSWTPMANTAVAVPHSDVSGC